MEKTPNIQENKYMHKDRLQLTHLSKFPLCAGGWEEVPIIVDRF